MKLEFSKVDGADGGPQAVALGSFGFSMRGGGRRKCRGADFRGAMGSFGETGNGFVRFFDLDG
jgi:hypothetical protein